MLSAEYSASQEDVRHADLIAIMACDLLDEAPMMALAVRQAWRDGAQVFLVGSDFPINAALRELFESVPAASLTDVPLAGAKRPVIISGTCYRSLEEIQASTIGTTKRAFMLDDPNTFGCALLAAEYGAVPLAQAIADKRVKGILAFEADLPDNLPEDITVIGAADWRPTGLLARAAVLLPSCAWVEQEGTFVNNEGRAQSFRQIMQPGLPIRGLDPAEHPPRAHRHDTPGGDVLPAWRIISGLLERLGEEPVESPLSEKWEHLRGLDAEGPGKLLNRQE
jgi:NADH-quinone oxidoreductase subunit G